MIYFVQAGVSGPVKIGFAGSAAAALQRVRTLQVGNAEELVLLGVMGGDLPAEAALHARFADGRLRGEWFVPSDELLSLAAAAGSAMPSVVELDLAVERWCRLGLVDAEGVLSRAGQCYVLVLEALARDAGVEDPDAGVSLMHEWAALA